jgi:hypothetical protein
MRIDGEWFPCDDGILRPIVRGRVKTAAGHWEPAIFLVDTGADCTVLCAATFNILGYHTNPTSRQLGGVGGRTPSVEVATVIQLFTHDNRPIQFRGSYAATTRLESLDMIILGRDIANFCSVIVDYPGNTVTLVRPPHSYRLHDNSK